MIRHNLWTKLLTKITKPSLLLSFLFVGMTTSGIAMPQDELVQVRLGAGIMGGLLLIGVIVTIVLIRRKPKDKNGKVKAKAYSADQKYLSGPEGINNFFNPRLK